MAAAIHVKIGTLTLPTKQDPRELEKRVTQELNALLEREPLRAAPPTQISIGGRIHVAREATVAHALARRIHTALQTGA
jgi:hypothetical protein